MADFTEDIIETIALSIGWIALIQFTGWISLIKFKEVYIKRYVLLLTYVLEQYT